MDYIPAKLKPFRKRIEAIIRNKYEKTILIAMQRKGKDNCLEHPSFVGGGVENEDHWIVEFINILSKNNIHIKEEWFKNLLEENAINIGEHPYISIQREVLEEVGILVSSASIRELPGSFKIDFSDYYSDKIPEKQRERVKYFEGVQTETVVVDFGKYDNSCIKKDVMKFDWYTYDEAVELFQSYINAIPDDGVVKILEHRLKYLKENRDLIGI